MNNTPPYYAMGDGTDVFDFIISTIISNQPTWCTQLEYSTLTMLYSHAFKYMRRCLHKGTTYDAITSDIDKAIHCLEKLRQEVYLVFEHHVEESVQ